MAKWIVDIYDTLAAAETAIELIDNTVTLHIVAFKEGSLQKVMVAKSA